jgi:DNA repair protein RadD
MIPELYDHQQKMLDGLKASMRRGNRAIILQGATGVGKTNISASAIHSALGKGSTLFFTVHRRDLITQTTKTFDKYRVPHGIIAAQMPSNPYAPAQICSIDTLKNRYAKTRVPKIIFVDEAHLSLAAGWMKVLKYYRERGSYIVGLTASPIRLSGEPFSDFYEDIVCGPSVRWLMENVNPRTGLTYLSNYRLFAPSTPNLQGVRTVGGDYNKAQLEDVMSGSVIVGDAVKHYLKLARDKRAIAFCVSIKNSQELVQAFRRAGVMAAHMDGETPHRERAAIIRAFASGDIKVLSNCSIMCEGFDLSAQVDMDVPVEAVLLLRPTQSLALYLQQVGRALRPKKEPAIILDHSGGALKHGLPCDDRVWTLEGSKKKKAKKGEAGPTIPMRQCVKCYCCHRTAPKCPNCGFVYPIQHREVDVIEDDLAEVDVVAQRRKRLMEQGQAQTLEELIELGKRRNYRHPEKWAAHLYSVRMAGRQA